MMTTTLCVVLLAGCATKAPPVESGVGAAWLDGIVPLGRQILFTGSSARLILARRGDEVRLSIEPALWAVPRLDLQADAPTGPPLRFYARRSELTYTTGFGRPYRIVVHYPKLGPSPAGQPPSAAPVLAYGDVEYHMRSCPPDRPHVYRFTRNTVAYTSPLHLVLTALGPVPGGRTKLLAVHKDGVDYWATIDATDGRRELRFPHAMLWADWSDENLVSQCVFTVDSISDWPRTTLHTRNFTKRGPVTASFLRMEPAARR